jgi:hypothetical protein
MSKILEQLKQAEEQRERLIAERKRLEAEADAALAAREREERYRNSPAAQAAAEPALPPRGAPPAAHTPQQQSRLAAGLAMAAALAVVFWVGTLVSRPAATPAPAARAPEKPAAPELFKYDRDVEAFAARLREKGLQ